MMALIVVYKVMPQSDQFDRAKQSLANLKPARLEEEPLAFGLKALVMTVQLPETDGAQDSFEENLSKLAGVASFAALRASRSLG
ncbi:MAG: elongation factor 1-beta [Candidatus Aenigmarchaeota archaeon]|nr:elongation factor 1-beta [Candidatus Aenigmarchaeota archaeon]